MALCDLRWFSQKLGKHVQTQVLLPNHGKPPFATFYLLHGLGDDHSIWNRRTRIEVYVENLPLIVVMPDGFRGFYTDNDQGPAYGQYIGEELVEQIERTFPVKRSRSARCIGGLSMGGYGAMRIGLKYADKFASVNSHSGAIGHGRFTFKDPEFVRIFGKKPMGTEHDLLYLAKKAKSAGKLPKILIDCGVDDFLINANRQTHAKLDALKVPHEYREFPGDHNWDYWDLHVREAIAFHAKVMKLKPVK